jgi:hypothetical protein
MPKLTFSPACILISVLFASFFFACKKDSCGSPSDLIIETNSPVVSGWNLTLKTGDLYGRYVWTGPDGWSEEYGGYTSESYRQELSSVSLRSSGEYTVKVYNDQGCIIGQGKTNVEVINPPPAPCTIARNTSTSSVIGVGTYNFASQDFGASSGYYLVSGTTAGGGGAPYLRFGFVGQTRPKPGKYTIDGGYFGAAFGTTGVFIQSGAYQFVAQGGTVYVTLTSNNKLSVSFCDVTFSNSINPAAPFRVSANVTEP